MSVDIFAELRHMKAIVYLAGELECVFDSEEYADGTLLDPVEIGPAVSWHRDDVAEALDLMAKRGTAKKDGNVWRWVATTG